MKEKEITACLLKGRREHVAPLAPRKYHRLVGGYLLLTFLALLLALGNYKNIIMKEKLQVVGDNVIIELINDTVGEKDQ